MTGQAALGFISFRPSCHSRDFGDLEPGGLGNLNLLNGVGSIE